MNRQIIIIGLILILSNSCIERTNDNSINNYFDSSIKTDENNFPVDSNQFYFPVKLFRDTDVLMNNDTFTVTWYSKHLRAMKEPLLFNRQENKEVFRFTWLRSFDNPVVVRIEKSNGKCKLIWKLCDGAGGYEPENMTISEEKVINEETWNQFIHLTEKTRFWEMKTVEKEQTGLDGEQWILEGKNEQRYHVVDRWSPKYGEYYDCCNFLIREIAIDSSKLKEVVFKADSSKMTNYGLVYIVVDETPRFGSEKPDFSKYLSENVKSYLSSKQESITGNVIVSFVIFEDGSVQDVNIIRGIRNDIDSSCIKLLKGMPRWIAGKVKGKPVKVQLATAIRFE